ncbi:MAG: hypothetical protein JXX14_18415 [Deltaproteobacteria bacterium]|nr:hypothetical protein [Deltaproteobacteria bacterium]
MSAFNTAIQIQDSNFYHPAAGRFDAHFGDGYAHGIVVVPEDVCGACEVRDVVDQYYMYQALYRNGALIDTNDPKALKRHMPFIRKAKGELLVTNAGLGGFLYRLLRKPDVRHITVAEPDFDIMELVEPSFSIHADKVTFVHASWIELAKYNRFDDVYFG